jgi:hypothetical protein
LSLKALRIMNVTTPVNTMIVFVIGLITVFSFPNQHLFATTFSQPWYDPAKQQADPSYDEATLAKMKSIKINVKWDNVSLGKALEDLTLQSKQADLKHEGVLFTSKPPLADQKVSLVLQNASLDDILGYLSGQARIQIKIHKGHVFVLPLNLSAP